MKKISFYLCVLVLSCFSIVASADAQKSPNHVYDKRKLITFFSSEELTEFLSGKTFMNLQRTSRYFFDKNGTYTEQYLEAHWDNKPGTTSKGKWVVNSSEEICLYKTVSSKGLGVVTEEETIEVVSCFDVKLAPLDWAMMEYVHHPFYFFFQDDPEKRKRISFNRTMFGNHLFTIEGNENYKKSKETIFAIAKRKNAGEFNLERRENQVINDPIMKKFYDFTVGKVIQTELGYLTYHPDGRAVVVPKRIYDGNYDIDFIKDYMETGLWYVEGNAVCFDVFSKGLKMDRFFCYTIHSSSDLLAPAERGYLMHEGAGHSRLITSDNIVSIDSMPVPDVFQ